MKFDEAAIDRLEAAKDRAWSERGPGGMYCTEEEYLEDERAAREWFGEDI